MATTSTTKAAFVKAVLAEMGSVRRLNKMSGYDRLVYVCNRIQTIVEYEVVTRHQGQIAQGVRFSLSGRLNMEPEQALMAMDTRQLVGLVYDLSKKCEVMGDVWVRLNAMYTPKRETAPVVTQEKKQEQEVVLTLAQDRVMQSLKSGASLCTVQANGKLVEARLYSEITGESSVSLKVASALLEKQQVRRYCWYDSTDGEHVEYVA